MVFGKPGVELEYELPDESVVTKLIFIPGTHSKYFLLANTKNLGSFWGRTNARFFLKATNKRYDKR